MKNLLSYDADAFEMHKKAVNNKNSGTKKDALISIEGLVGQQYELYLDKFGNKKLFEVGAYGFEKNLSDYLIELYNSDSLVIKEFRKYLRSKQTRNITTTCQYCTINSVNTLDHFIPKEDFPEFSVNPLNLLPCCPECNSKKHTFCFEGNDSLFLNLYFDELPEKEYLKADFDFTDDIPMVTFSLHNPENIEEPLFKTISNHYRKLNLLERMRAASEDKITDIIISIEESFSLNNDIEFLKRTIIESETKYKKAYGFNHWKSVLKLSLIKYDEFWETYIING